MAIHQCQVCHPGDDGRIVNSFAIDFANAGNDFAAIEHMDSDGDGYANIVEIMARTLPGEPQNRPALSPPDRTAPKVTSFKVPALSSSRFVPIGDFHVQDNKAVNGYLITETATPPAPASAFWNRRKPTVYAFDSAGPKTLYAWARDEAGNISTPTTATVTIREAVRSNRANKIIKKTKPQRGFVIHPIALEVRP